MDSPILTAEQIRDQREAAMHTGSIAMIDLCDSHEALRAYIGDSDMMRESIQALQDVLVEKSRRITELEAEVQMWKETLARVKG
jgi:hypothetical protein